MGNINYFLGIVKVLENPIQIYTKNKILITIFHVEIPQFRKNKIVLLIFWGSLAQEVNNYYKLNDYILIEGYLAIKTKKKLKLFSKTPNQIIITVGKIYPFLLNLNKNLSVS